MTAKIAHRSCKSITLAAALAAAFTVGCAPTLDPEYFDGVPTPTDLVAADAAAEAANPAAVAAAAPPEPLRLNPTPELVPAVEAAIISYFDTFGLEIEIAEDGIPVTTDPELTWKSRRVDGLAHYDRLCAWSDCNDPRHGVYIVLDASLLDVKSQFMALTMDHELGHVASGWGLGKGIHLGLENRMGPGARGGVVPEWTAADRVFICAGAPCSN